MTVYTHKHVNGVLTVLNAADQAALTARDAEGWVGPPTGATTMMMAAGPQTMMAAAPRTADSPAAKVARLAASAGLTVAELKAELAP